MGSAASNANRSALSHDGTDLASGSYDTLRLFSSGMQHYDGLKKIGRGSYGTVYLVRDKRNGRYYCLKQIWLGEGSSAADRAGAELEVKTLRSLDHPSVVRYHDHFVHQDGHAGAPALRRIGDR